MRKEDYGHIRREAYLKPSPDTLREDNHVLKMIGMTLTEYRFRFNDVSRMTEEEIEICVKYHPHSTLLNPVFQQTFTAVSSQESSRPHVANVTSSNQLLESSDIVL